MTEVKPVQLLKADRPIEVTELGIVTDVILVQPAKVYCFISVTPLGITRLVTKLPFMYNEPEQHIGLEAPSEKFILHHWAMVPVKMAVDKESQNAKAISPMLVTEPGMVMETKLIQSEKAPAPILVTEFGMTIDGNPIQAPKT